MNKEELINVLTERKTDVEALEESFKTMKPGEDGWYYMGYIEDEYNDLEPVAEKFNMKKELDEVYDRFWPLEHMTYEDVQKYFFKKG